MLTRSEFVAWLGARRAAGESLAVIGSSMGVSHEAVRKWLAGGEPSQMALMLAATLSHEARELSHGLPYMPRGPYRPRQIRAARQST